MAHHYRDSWEWDDAIMPTAAARLDAWLAARRPPGQSDSETALAAVRARLDDDLDTPGAVAAIDAAVARGEGVASAAALLGVFLVGEPDRLTGRHLAPPKRRAETVAPAAVSRVDRVGTGSGPPRGLGYARPHGRPDHDHAPRRIDPGASGGVDRR